MERRDGIKREMSEEEGHNTARLTDYGLTEG